MSAPLTILSDPGTRALTRSLVTSLPRSYVLADRAADVVVVAGAPGWAAGAVDILLSGVRFIVVIDPHEDDPVTLHELAAGANATGTTVMLSEPFAGNTALRDAADLVRGLSTVALDSRVPTDTRHSLLVQLRIARRLGLVSPTIHDFVARERASLAAGTARGNNGVLHLRSMVSLTTAGPPRHTVRGYSADAMVTADIFAADTARPALITAIDHDGSRLLPTIYESAHRTTLRELVAPASAAVDIGGFAEDVELVRATV